MKLTFFQKLRSYIYPVDVLRRSSAVNPVLALLYYRGRWQLATMDAVYSDGVYYRPLLAAFKALKSFLPSVKSVLVLGTGLGSAVQILHKKGFYPSCTLVELDDQVLSLALELMPAAMLSSITAICSDAQDYLEEYSERFNLVIVDVFKGREVPDFVLSASFLNHCKERLLPGGRLILNYIVNQPGDEQKAKAALGAAFKETKELSFSINKVYIATA